LKVVHWNMRYFPLLGGIETHVDTLIRHMPDIEFEIVTDAIPGAAKVEKYRPNATIRRFPPIDRSRVTKHRKLAVPVAALRDTLRDSREARYLTTSAYDVLHVHDFEKNLVILGGVTRLKMLGDFEMKLHDPKRFKRPHLLTKHFMFTEENSTPALRRWEEGLVRQFDVVVCVDKTIQQKFASSEGAKRVLFIPNPIDTEVFAYSPPPNDEVLHLAFAGRLDVARGESVLTEFARNLPKGTDLTMAVQHPGERLKDIQAVLGKDRVKIELDVPYEKMPRFLGGINVLLNPITDTYSTTRATLEAMAAGRPVVMFNTGERYPIRHGENSYLVPPNAKGLADLVENLKADRKGLETVALRARKDVEREFAATVVAPRIRQIYEELAS